ncbi:hypothetical protein C8Q80DRAFT_1264543 [Daedaleopsis nitida]|nr:hypothetical protein C8Q80DRAFT_1264543 [Daedaleopsis nitida]
MSVLSRPRLVFRPPLESEVFADTPSPMIDGLLALWTKLRADGLFMCLSERVLEVIVSLLLDQLNLCSVALTPFGKAEYSDSEPFGNRDVRVVKLFAEIASHAVGRNDQWLWTARYTSTVKRVHQALVREIAWYRWVELCREYNELLDGAGVDRTLPLIALDLPEYTRAEVIEGQVRRCVRVYYAPDANTLEPDWVSAMYQDSDTEYPIPSWISAFVDGPAGPDAPGVGHPVAFPPLPADFDDDPPSPVDIDEACHALVDGIRHSYLLARVRLLTAASTMLDCIDQEEALLGYQRTFGSPAAGTSLRGVAADLLIDRESLHQLSHHWNRYMLGPQYSANDG